MLKIIESTESAANFEKTKNEVVSNSLVDDNSIVSSDKVTNPKCFIKRKNQPEKAKCKD